MESSHTHAGFHTTSWAMILDARGDRAALERLLRLYWPPVYSFIRGQGFGPHDASDLTQEFLSSVVLSRDLIGRADPNRGKFRSFLKQALRNFLIDHLRAVRARKKLNQAVSIHAASLEDAEKGGGIDPAENRQETDVFDREWAATLVRLALERLEDSLRQDQMTQHWTAFEINVVRPTTGKGEALALEEVARLVNAPSADVVSNMIQTTKRRFRRVLREIVAETVDNPDAIEMELEELRRLAGNA